MFRSPKELCMKPTSGRSSRSWHGASVWVPLQQKGSTASGYIVGPSCCVWKAERLPAEAGPHVRDLFAVMVTCTGRTTRCSCTHLVSSCKRPEWRVFFFMAKTVNRGTFRTRCFISVTCTFWPRLLFLCACCVWMSLQVSDSVEVASWLRGDAAAWSLWG